MSEEISIGPSDDELYPLTAQRRQAGQIKDLLTQNQSLQQKLDASVGVAQDLDREVKELQEQNQSLQLRMVQLEEALRKWPYNTGMCLCPTHWRGHAPSCPVAVALSTTPNPSEYVRREVAEKLAKQLSIHDGCSRFASADALAIALYKQTEK